MRWHPQWAVPIAAAATAAAIWVAIPKDRGVDEFERTVGPALSESASQVPNAPAADAAPPPARQEGAAASKATSEAAASEATSEGTLRRDAPAAPPQEAAKERVANDAVGNARAGETRERDQDRKAEAPRQAAADAPAAAAPATAAAPAQAQEETRQRAEALSGLARQAPQAPQAPAREAVSPDPLIRWRILPTRRLERSTNGGKSWEPVPFPQPIGLTAVRAPSANSAIVTAADGRQFRTEDGGKTWNPVQP